MFARSYSRTSFAAMLAASALLGAGALAISGTALAHDDDRDGGAVKLLTTIPVPAGPGDACPSKAPANPLFNLFTGMCVFDISWIDQDTQRYYLADRSNSAVDVVDAKTSTFLKQIKGGFAGAKLNGPGTAVNNDISGPNGVLTFGRWLFVTDAPSRVVSIDLTTDSIVSTVSTSSTSPNRADELAYDPEDSVILAVNNADDPPFATLITVNTSNGHLTAGPKVVFNAANGVDATNGAEQPVWDSRTGKFYISIPQVGPNAANGAVARINPHTGAIEAVFPVSFCQPAGLTVGPRGDLLIGCSVVFDSAGVACSTTAADLTTCSAGHFAAPKQVIMDARNGSIDRDVFGVGASDEVWYNSGDGRYYTASRNNPEGPVLGVIDAKSQKLLQVVPTVPLQYGSAHSVAANRHNNHVLVPLSANNVVPNCLTGCIGVYGRPGDDD
jgi:hypothetical protein